MWRVKRKKNSIWNHQCAMTGKVSVLGVCTQFPPFFYVAMFALRELGEKKTDAVLIAAL
jgi:hypothetical protein